jgi:hypothetical protein
VDSVSTLWPTPCAWRRWEAATHTDCGKRTGFLPSTGATGFCEAANGRSCMNCTSKLCPLFGWSTNSSTQAPLFVRSATCSRQGPSENTRVSRYWSTQTPGNLHAAACNDQLWVGCRKQRGPHPIVWGLQCRYFEIPAPLDFPRLQGKGPGLLSDPGVVSSSTSFALPSDRDVASTVSQSNRVAALFDELSAGRNPVEHVKILGGTHALCTKPFRN